MKLTFGNTDQIEMIKKESMIFDLRERIKKGDYTWCDQYEDDEKRYDVCDNCGKYLGSLDIYYTQFPNGQMFVECTKCKKINFI